MQTALQLDLIVLLMIYHRFSTCLTLQLDTSAHLAVVMEAAVTCVYPADQTSEITGAHAPATEV